MVDVIADIIAERRRQSEKFGDQSWRDLFVMLGVLGEEVGEVCKAAIDRQLSIEVGLTASLSDVRGELVQVAAVAVQIIEYLDTGAYNVEWTQQRAQQTPHKKKD